MPTTGALTSRHSDGTVAALVDYAGCSYRQFDYWCQKGIFGDGQRPGSGRSRNGMTEQDMRLARFLTRLSAAGWGPGGTTEKLAEIAARVRSVLAEAPPTGVVVPLTAAVDVYVSLGDDPSAEVESYSVVLEGSS